jgi:cephalosporin hydroxylase
MNDLEKYFYQNKGRFIDRWSHYFDIYDQYFSKYRGKEIVVVEIGVLEGGGLLMWKNYFGEKAKIYGIDINSECANKIQYPNIEVIIGSQSDREFLRKLKTQIPKIDILIDDGGHHMDQQIITFEELFDYIKDDGIYLCEDLHTSYWEYFEGGFKAPNSFIEYSKNFIEQLHAYTATRPEMPVTYFTEHVNAIHYYDSVLVIEKKLRNKPLSMRTGRNFDTPYIPS